MIGDGKPVRLVTHPLEQVKRLPPPLDGERLTDSRQIHLLEAFGEAHRRDVEPELIEHRDRPAQLPCASVDDDEGRRVGEFASLVLRPLAVGEVRGEPAAQHLFHCGEVILACDLLDLELAVIRLAGQAILKHHHRADGVASLDRGDVVALDPQRWLIELEDLLEIVERPRPRVVIGVPPHAVAPKLFVGVVDRGLQDPAFRSAHRDPQRHRSLSALDKPCLPQFVIFRQFLNEDRSGRGLRAVQPAEQDPDERRRGDVFHAIDDRRLSSRDPAASHVQDHEHRLELVERQTDYVEVFLSVGDELLTFHGAANRGEAVSQSRRLLVFLPVGCKRHVCFELIDDRRGVSGEECGEALHVSGVGISVDGSDTGRRTLLDVSEQARPAGRLMAAILGIGTGANRKRAQEQIERLPDRIGVCVRPEVLDSLAALAAHHHGPWPFLVGRDGEVREALVVAEPDVEPRLMLLDERVFEHDRGDIVRGDDPLDGCCGGDHRLRLEWQICGKVIRDSLAKRLGFADVQDLPVCVAEQIHPGGVGNL